MYSKGTFKAVPSQAFISMHFEKSRRYVYLLLFRLVRVSITRHLLKEDTAMKLLSTESTFER